MTDGQTDRQAIVIVQLLSQLKIFQDNDGFQLQSDSRVSIVRLCVHNAISKRQNKVS